MARPRLHYRAGQSGENKRGSEGGGGGRQTILIVWSQEAVTNVSFCRLFQSTETASAECSCQTFVGSPYWVSPIFGRGGEKVRGHLRLM